MNLSLWKGAYFLLQINNSVFELDDKLIEAFFRLILLYILADSSQSGWRGRPHIKRFVIVILEYVDMDKARRIFFSVSDLSFLKLILIQFFLSDEIFDWILPEVEGEFPPICNIFQHLIFIFLKLNECTYIKNIL